MFCSIDISIISLLGLTIIGAGLFEAFHYYYTEKLHGTFFDENPYAIKAAIINNIHKTAFTALTLFGLLIQVSAVILTGYIPSRSYSVTLYAIFFVACILFMYPLVKLVAFIARRIARPRWREKITELRREAFNSVKEILDNEGWRNDQLEIKDSLSDPDENKRKNLESAEKGVNQLEDLLEIKSNGSLQERIAHLETFFADNQPQRPIPLHDKRH